MSFRAIELTPGMKYDSLVQSLNENFVRVENAAKVYKDTGSLIFLETSVAAGASINQTHTVTHNLGVKPRYDLFVTAEGRATAGGGIISPFPSTPILLPIHWGMANATTNFAINYFIGADEDNVYITRRITNITGSNQTAPPDEVVYYIYREIVE